MRHKFKRTLTSWVTTAEVHAKAQSEPEEPPRVWWRETLLRILQMAIVALLVEFALGMGPWGGGTVHPHPYWFLVLPLAASRGLVAGVLAAGVATGMLLLGLAISGDLTINRDSLSDPLIFFAAAILVGELRDLLRERVRYLAAEREELRVALEQAAYDHGIHERTIAELERRLAHSSGDLSSLVHATRRIDSGDSRDLYGLTLELVAEHAADAASIIEIGEDGAMQRVLTIGEARRHSDELQRSPLVADALRHGEPTNAFDAPEGDFPAGPCMVSPILDHGRRVVALLTIDDIAPERLQPGTPRIVASIADWASYGLTRMATGEAPLDRNQLSLVENRSSLRVAATRILPAECLAQALVQEFSRCERFSVNLSVLGVQFVRDHELDADELAALDEAVRTNISTTLRDTDSLFAFGYPGCYAIVLPGTDIDGSSAARARVESLAHRVERLVGSSVHFTAAGPEHSEFTAPHVLDALARTFRTRARRPLGLRSDEPRDPRATESVQRLAERVRVEHGIAIRFGFPFQLLSIDLAGTRGRIEDGLMPQALHDAVGRSLRGVPECFEISPTLMIFLVPGLVPEARDLVATRVRNGVSATALRGATVAWALDSLDASECSAVLQSLMGGRVA